MSPSLPLQRANNDQTLVSLLFSSRLIIGISTALSLLLSGFVLPLCAEDEEVETWTQSNTQSSYQVNISLSGYSTTLSPWQVCPMSVEASKTTWEVWTSNLGHTELRNAVETPVTDAVFSCSSSNVSCSWATSSSAYYYFTMQYGDEDVTVSASCNGVTASSTIHFAYQAPAGPPEEVWSYMRTEGLLSTSLNLNYGSTVMTAGQSAQVQIHADYQSWDIYTSSPSNFTSTQNYQVSPASGASVLLSLVTQNGTIDTTAIQLDAQGNAVVTFTGGGGPDTLVATIASYGYTAQSTSASMDFATPEPTAPTFDHAEGYVSVDWQLLKPQTYEPATSWLGIGDSLIARAVVTYTSWEIWKAPDGHTEERNRGTAPAIGAAVSLGLWGTAALSSPVGVTDSNGLFDTVVTKVDPGTEYLYGEASYAGADASAYQQLNWLDWALERSNYDVFVDWTILDSDGNDITGQSLAQGVTVRLVPTIRYASNERWTNSYGGVETRSAQAGPIENVPIQISKADDGDGALASFDPLGQQVVTIYTGPDGRPVGNSRIDMTPCTTPTTFTISFDSFQVPYVVSAGGGASPPDYASGNTTALENSGSNVSDTSSTSTGSGGNWVYQGDESGLTLSVSVSGGQDSSSASASASVTLDSWEVWVNTDTQETEERNRASNPADGAPLSWSATGGASLSAYSSSTGIDGTSGVGVTRGSQLSIITVTASFGGKSATATADVEPESGSGGSGDNNSDENGSEDQAVQLNQSSSSSSSSSSATTNNTSTGSGGSTGDPQCGYPSTFDSIQQIRLWDEMSVNRKGDRKILGGAFYGRAAISVQKGGQVKVTAEKGYDGDTGQSIEFSAALTKGKIGYTVNKTSLSARLVPGSVKLKGSAGRQCTCGANTGKVHNTWEFEVEMSVTVDTDLETSGAVEFAFPVIGTVLGIEAAGTKSSATTVSRRAKFSVTISE